VTVLRHLSSRDPIQTNTAVPSKQPSTSTQKPTRSSIQSVMELEKNKTTAVAANAKAVRTQIAIRVQRGRLSGSGLTRLTGTMASATEAE
jgi:hypothetical protein